MVGELEGASEFECPNLYCKWSLQSGSSWKVLGGATGGHTQTDAVRPGQCVMIPPGTRHRAVGRMKVLIVVLPKFDPEDEWLD